MLLSTSVSDAATCYVEHAWRSVPRPLTEAPTNTHFFLFAPPDWNQRVCDGRWKPRCRNGSFSLKLFESRTRENLGRPRHVAAEARVHETKRSSVIELVPRAALAPKRRYEAWLVERGNKNGARLVGTFRVGPKADLTAPSWSGIKRAVYQPAVPPPPLLPNHPSGRRVVTITSWFNEKSGLQIYGPPASGADLVAVWAGDPGKPIDYSKPPATYESYRGNGNTIPLVDLGFTSDCADSTFEVPDRDAIRIGLKFIDLAGNASAPSEIDVKLK